MRVCTHRERTRETEKKERGRESPSTVPAVVSFFPRTDTPPPVSGTSSRTKYKFVPKPTTTTTTTASLPTKRPRQAKARRNSPAIIFSAARTRVRSNLAAVCGNRPRLVLLYLTSLYPSPLWRLVKTRALRKSRLFHHIVCRDSLIQFSRLLDRLSFSSPVSPRAPFQKYRFLLSAHSFRLTVPPAAISDNLDE